MCFQPSPRQHTIWGMLTTLDSRDAPQHFVMSGVSWEYYEHTLEQIGDRPIRVAFLDGVIELMSPLPEHDAVPREPICARLGVPEVWRYHEGRLTIRLLSANGTYADAPASKLFPFLPIDDLARFVPKMIADDETRVLSEFQEWVRDLPR
jgi:hypothetical protein